MNSYKNRGLDFEFLINLSNEFYRKNNIALIYKKPTPIKIIKINNKTKMIEKAVFEMPSTTDYNGIFNGKYIDFEAKETISQTSFPLKNIHPHQIKHLKTCKEMGGISFIIVYFKLLNEIYVLDIDEVISINKKSIPLSFFKEKGKLVKQEYLCPINYLKVIKKEKD